MADKSNTFISGVAIDSARSSYIANFGGETSNIFSFKLESETVLFFADVDEENNPILHPYNSITFCKHPEGGVVIAITQQGHVRVKGVDDAAGEDEHIPTASVLTKVTTLSDKAFAVGGNREIWKRAEKNKWILVSPPPSKEEIFFSIDGYNENDFYVGCAAGELWHYKNGNWTQLETLTNQIIVSICCAGNGVVYACGQNALIIAYENGKGKVIEYLVEKYPNRNLNQAYGDIWGTAWFKEKLYLSGFDGVFTLEGNEMTPVDFGDNAPETTYHLSVNGESLISIGAYEAMLFNGEYWELVD